MPRRTGELGHPQLISWPNIAIVQVVKQRVDGHLNISRRIVQGSKTMLNLPAIYGKGPDEDQRCAIAASFIHPNGPQALIVANDVELAWPLVPVSALVFVARSCQTAGGEGQV